MHFQLKQNSSTSSSSDGKCWKLFRSNDSEKWNKQRDETKCNWWEASLIKSKLNKLKQIMIERRGAICRHANWNGIRNELRWKSI